MFYFPIKVSYAFLFLITLGFTRLCPKSIKCKVFVLTVLMPDHQRVTHGHARTVVEEIIGPQEHLGLIGCSTGAGSVF